MLCAASLSACTSAHHAPLTPPPAEVETPLVQRNDSYVAQLSARRIPDGSLMVVSIGFTQPFSGTVMGEFAGKKFRLYPQKDSKSVTRFPRFEGLFGVPHGTHPGPADLRISATGMKPGKVRFEVVEAGYKSEILKVAERKINPYKKDMPRIIREVALIKKAVATETPAKYWSGPFQLPLEGRVTDAFGTKRLYNGELKSYHGGIDFHAPMGTPIYSSGAGRIIMAKNLFFSGNTVMIDHGYGLITMYFHMSKMKVRKGQLVRAHQLLGLSGATGRVTGPHVHWQCDVHDVKINPMDLIDGSAAAELR